MLRFIHRYYILLFVLLCYTISSVAQDEDSRSGTIYPPRHYSLRAEQHINANAWETAKRDIDAGLELYPDDPTLLYLNGRYYYEVHDDLQSARYNLIKAIQMNNDHYKARRLLVDIEDHAKHYSSAICYINELLEVEPYDRDLWRRKIGLYNKMGKTEDADATLERLARIYPNDTVVRQDLERRKRARMENLTKKQSLSANAAELEQKIQEEPYELSYYIELMGLYYKMGEYEKSIGVANRGLISFPKNLELVRKAAGIMTEMGQYTRALEFVKRWRGKGPLYNSIAREAADNVRLQDPYEAKAKVYADTHDHAALAWLLNTAITRGYYEDAKDYIRESYLQGGDTTQLLLKEYSLEKRFGSEQAALRLLHRLHERIPNDVDLAEEYALRMINLATAEMAQSQWLDASLHLQQALEIITPESEYWQSTVSRQIIALGNLNQMNEARSLYYSASEADTTSQARFAAAYEEVSAVYTKNLIDEERYQQALREAQALLRILPASEVGLRNAINMSQTLQRSDLLRTYIEQGYELYPNDPYFIVKYALLLHENGHTIDALELLHPLSLDEQYAQPQLITAFSGVSDEYALALLKKHETEKALAVVDTALVYDPKNQGLIHTKGLVYEQLKDYSHAIRYQGGQYAAAAEQRDWLQNLRYLRYRALKNRVEASYIGAFYDTRQDELASIGHLYSIATLAYSHLWTHDTWTLQISYKGIDGYHSTNTYESAGIGLEFMTQWEHSFRYGWTLMLNGSYSTRYFNRYGGNLSLSWAAPKGWTPSLRFGYRRTPPTYLYFNQNNAINADYKEYNLFLLTPSLTKDWERVSLTLLGDLTYFEKSFYYNVGLKGRFFVNHDRVSSVNLAVGAGTFPELSFFDQTALQGLSYINAMLSAGVKYLITEHWCIDITGTWNTYYDPVIEGHGSVSGTSRNIYSIDIHLQVAF